MRMYEEMRHETHCDGVFPKIPKIFYGRLVLLLISSNNDGDVTAAAGNSNNR